MTDVVTTQDALLINPNGRSGWTRHVTIERILLVGLLMINGTTWKATNDISLMALEKRVAALELASTLIPERTANTYVRQDVMIERLRSIEERLSNIEASVRRRP